MLGLNRAAMLLAVSFMFVSVSCDSSGTGDPPAHPIALYPVDENTAYMDALLGGVLERDGPCIYVRSTSQAGERALIAFPEDSATWDEAQGVVFLGGARLAPGAPVTIAGGFTPLRDYDGWPAPPHEDCDATRLWLAARAGPVVP